MSDANALCRVCGHSLGHAPCACAKCQTPAHPDCFAYSGGCSIFGCGSQAARFADKAPNGWRPQDDGTALVPIASVTVPGKGALMDRALHSCCEYWRTTAQLELFSVLGQTWFAAVAFGAALLGRWSMSSLMLASLIAVVLAHANSLLGLAQMGLILTSADDEGPLDGPRRAVATRRASITRSRRLHIAGSIFLGIGLLQGAVTAPSWAWIVVLFAAMVPWFSLAPRWGMEMPLLDAAKSAPQA
jgi:hypothetical protein